MRQITAVTTGRVDGVQLIEELVAAGATLVSPFPLSMSDGALRIALDLDPEDSSQDALVLATVAAHTAPAEPTMAQFRRARIRRMLAEFRDDIEIVIRAVVLAIADAEIADRQAYNALRADLRANRTGASGTAPALAVPTIEQVVNSVLDHIDSLAP